MKNKHLTTLLILGSTLFFTISKPPGFTEGVFWMVNTGIYGEKIQKEIIIKPNFPPPITKKKNKKLTKKKAKVVEDFSYESGR